MPLPAADHIDRIAAVDYIHAHTRTAILTGALTPGERVTGHSIAVATGYSMTPVHLAIQRLERDGLLTRGSKPSTRATVTTVSTAVANAARAALQMLAAAARTTPAGADAFLVALTALRPGDMDAFDTAHQHAMDLADRCNNQVFADLIRDGLDGMLYRATHAATGQDTAR